MGDIQWLWTYLKLCIGDIEPFSEILKGKSNPSFPRHLTDVTRQVLALVEHAIQHQQVRYIDYAKPWETYVLPTWHTSMAVLWQEGQLLRVHLFP